MIGRIARAGIALAAAGLLLLLLAGPLSRLGVWHFRTGFGALRWASTLGAAGAVLCLIGLFEPGVGRRLWRALGLAAGLLAFAVPWTFRSHARAHPMIHNISTDLEDPPLFEAVLALRPEGANPAGPAGPEVVELQAEGYPDLGPAILTAPPERAFEAALAAARALGWEIVAAEPGRGRIEATDTTFWFGFQDDVVVRVRPLDGGSRVDVRSVSRVGRGDAGANARRIRRFLERL